MPQTKSNIVLTGMPAVGKSTIGVLLAKRLGLAFVDTDITLQMSEGKTLQELIQTYGLEQFCDLEAGHILSLNIQASVIATGGSVVYRKAAMRHLGRSGVVVYLDIDLASLEMRLRDIDARGVVYAPGQSLADLYAERVPLYSGTADITVQASDVAPDQMVNRVIAALGD